MEVDDSLDDALSRYLDCTIRVMRASVGASRYQQILRALQDQYRLEAAEDAWPPEILSLVERYHGIVVQLANDYDVADLFVIVGSFQMKLTNNAALGRPLNSLAESCSNPCYGNPAHQQGTRCNIPCD